MSKYPTLRNGSIPSLIDCDSAAAEIITILRDPVYDEDRLFRGHGRHTRVGSERAEGEYERRNKTRRVYQTLSRYYPLEAGRSTWTTTQLLLRGKHEYVYLTSRRFTETALL